MESSQLTKDDGHVRFSHELSEGEKEATGKRKAKVLDCLKSLGIACAEVNTPNIAVLGSGGGLRAMIAFLGTLVELKNQGLLDAVMYLCGVSGSTWCMSFLYQEKDWTEKVQVLEERLRDTLSKSSCDIQEEFAIAIQAAEDELFSLTDDWASFFVYPALKQYDKTKLSEHKDASSDGTNPYPIYAAIEANQVEKGTWFEFTPHESGFPGLGAFVCTEDLGSKFKDGDLKEKRDEKNICYLQGLWGSALGSMEKIINYLIDCLMEIFRNIRKHWYAVNEAGLQGPPGSVPFSGTDCTCAHCQGVHHLLELLVHASAGKDCEGVFRQLKEVLKEENSKNSYLKCCEVSETWHLKTLEERITEFAHLIRIFENELGGIDCTSAHCQGLLLLLLELHIHASAGRNCEGIFRQLKEVLKEAYSNLKCWEVNVSQYLKSWEDWIVEIAKHIWTFVKELGGHVWDVWTLLWKTVTCICSWTWGWTNNFLYRDREAQSTGLTNKEFIYLIDAGLAINSAYPLVLRPERKVKLILSFDFSSGDPFETIKKTANYCETNKIPFPKITPEKIKDIDKPCDCYSFRGTDVPTVMHFPLFNKKNCPGEKEIKDFRDTFTTFTSSYSEHNVKALLEKAKMNVTNNKQNILKEIRQIVSSSTKEF